MHCPHCKKTIDWEIVIRAIKNALCAHPATASGLEAAGKDNAERAELITWLERWRQDCGLPATDLKGRSTGQLRKLFAQAKIGKSYRAGRTWKVAAH
jgi:hypothetical protein